MAARRQGGADKRMKQKTKPLGKYEKGTPSLMQENWFGHPPKGYPMPKGVRVAGKRPTQAEHRTARAQAAAMAVHDGLDATMPLDQRKMLYGNAKPLAKIGEQYSKHRAL